jgi:hypothetical protein
MRKKSVFRMCLQDFNLHHVWDGCATPSPRAKHGKGVCGCVITEAVNPRNWQNFLRVDTNETQLFKFVRRFSQVV